MALKRSDILTLVPGIQVERIGHIMSRSPKNRCSECGWANNTWSPFFCVTCGVCETCARNQPRCSENTKSGYQSLTVRGALFTDSAR